MSEDKKETSWIKGKFAGVFVDAHDTVHALFQYEEPHHAIQRLGLVEENRLQLALNMGRDKKKLLPLAQQNPDHSQTDHEARIVRGLAETQRQLDEVERALAEVIDMRRRLNNGPARKPHSGPSGPFRVIDGGPDPIP